MRKFYCCANDYYKTASIMIENAKWPVFALESIIEWICSIIPSISFPNIKYRLKEQDSIDFNGGEYTTLKEWYGDISGWFCCNVHNKVLNYLESKKDTIMLDVNYDKLREFDIKYNKNFWKELEDIDVIKD